MKEEKDFIVDELLGLNSNETKEDSDTHTENEEKIEPALEEEVVEEKVESIEDVQKTIVNELKKGNIINDELSNTSLDPKNDTFVSIIKDNVSFCVDELKDVNDAMTKISSQKNSEMFFRKSENIKLLSQYMAKMANVNQKTLDLLILLLGASGKISDEYETILTTIDELGELNHGEAEVLNYLLKIKKMVHEIRDNDTKMKNVLKDNEITKEIVANADEAFKKEIEESRKSRKIVESKCNRLQKRIRLNNFYISICLLMILAVSIFIGVKFYVF
jgi:hypothetical protein